MLRRTNSSAAKSASGAATSAKNDALVAMNIAKAKTDVLENEIEQMKTIIERSYHNLVIVQDLGLGDDALDDRLNENNGKLTRAPALLTL